MNTIDDLTETEFMELAHQATTDLMSWLEAHEDDIALGINDFGALKPVFFFTVGRQARPIVVH